MQKQKIIFWMFAAALIASNVFFAGRYFAAQKELNQTKIIAENKKTNERVLNFAGLFVTQVLKADGEVDFETRLKLENAVRDLKDDEILSQWQKFVESQTESEAQEEVKNLLEMLINRIE